MSYPNLQKKYSVDEKIKIVRRMVIDHEDMRRLSIETGVEMITLHSWRKTFGADAVFQAKAEKIKMVKASEEPAKRVQNRDNDPRYTGTHPVRGKRYSDDIKRFAVAEYEKGESVVVIAETIGTGPNTVYNWIRKAEETKSSEPKGIIINVTPEPTVELAPPLLSPPPPEPEPEPLIIKPRGQAAAGIPLKKSPSHYPQTDERMYTQAEMDEVLDELDEMKILYAEQSLELMKLKRGR